MVLGWDWSQETCLLVQTLPIINSERSTLLLVAGALFPLWKMGGVGVGVGVVLLDDLLSPPVLISGNFIFPSL